ncbi:tyrosinase family protein [Streptomyces sp. OF3]|uniref:Tyrosinase family protein n=1 Tax=Streptomyces alkaliterrae TaxID=2213162 RepID=A0A7W3WKV5_9ACTN|nr:tyrosinase family protein [Streptomyces alkaliterrae]MBB1253740.1 tyrosinase family protein [Streptomyces alkaliterrae]
MTAVRHNVLTDAGARDAYARGVLLLKREVSGFTTDQFGIPGASRPVRTYDLFVIWHCLAMRTAIPPGGEWWVRNAAHSGPVFLPWHRLMLAVLEYQLQRVLDDEEFGIPYWDWSVDGSLPAPGDAPLWRPECMGGQGDPVADGPFAFDDQDPGTFRVLLETDMFVNLRQTDRGLRRAFGREAATLPNAVDVGEAFNTAPPLGDPTLARYDSRPWLAGSPGFRSRLEGYSGPGLHNQVHRWVGADMTLASSPNDPVFYLHHANVDRLWEAWMNRNGRVYLPSANEPETMLGGRIDDALMSPFGLRARPRDLLDLSALHTYDTVP